MCTHSLLYTCGLCGLEGVGVGFFFHTHIHTSLDFIKSVLPFLCVLPVMSATSIAVETALKHELIRRSLHMVLSIFVAHGFRCCMCDFYCSCGG